MSSEQVELFEGLSVKQIQAIRHCKNYLQQPAGEMIFNEGNPAQSLFVILSGQVRIFNRTHTEEKPLAVMGAGDVMGEIGLLSETHRRTASARAIAPTLLFEIPNPLELSKMLGDPLASIRLMQNLIRLLRRRLEHGDAHALRPAPSPLAPYPEKALASIEQSLNLKYLRLFGRERELEQGQYLIRQGEPADGFYYLSQGSVEVIDDENGARRLNRMSAPAIIGEVGFFSRHPRLASVRALEDSVYYFLSTEDFEKKVQFNQNAALEMVGAAAQLIVHLILMHNERCAMKIEQ